MTSGTADQSYANPIRAGRMRDRGIRKPTHPYSVEQEAFGITLHFLAPVLPGETLISLNDQSRSVSDPVLNKLKGWWLEKSYFYVPLSMMSDRLIFKDMMLDFDKDISGAHAGAAVARYHTADTIDYVAQCNEAVVGAWYRDEAETWSTPVINNVPVAQLSRRNFMNSLQTEAIYEALDVAMPDTGQEAREAMDALDEWEFTRKVEGENWEYEDYLRDQGVSVSRGTKDTSGGETVGDVPERLMTNIEWSFPTNTVLASDGTVTSALIWSPKIRIKDKFFNEPGFICGYTVVRPKVYYIKQTGTATALLDSASMWLPAILEDNPDTTVKKIATTGAPYTGVTAATVLDIKDLFLHGEQYVNHTIAAADNGINLPEADADRLYPVAADLDALFVTGSSNLIRTDGRVSLRIRSHVKETSAAK